MQILRFARDDNPQKESLMRPSATRSKSAHHHIDFAALARSQQLEG